MHTGGAYFWSVSLHFSSVRSFTCTASDCHTDQESCMISLKVTMNQMIEYFLLLYLAHVFGDLQSQEWESRLTCRRCTAEGAHVVCMIN